MTTIGSIATDILHEFLLHSNNRRDLAAFVQSGHVVYDIFKEHPNSILKTVVCNELGILENVFPYCWETLRLLNDKRILNVSRSGRHRINVEEELTISSLRGRHVSQLREMQRTVDYLEKMYSLQCKDSINRYDSLTATEVYRFQVAAHLFWQYQSIWQAHQNSHRKLTIFRIVVDEEDGEDAEEEESDDEERDDEEDNSSDSDSQGDQNAQASSTSSNDQTSLSTDAIDQETVEQCQQFLEAQPIEHLLWMHEFRAFLLNQIDLELDISNHQEVIVEARAWPHNQVYGPKMSTDQWRHHCLSTSLFMIYHSVHSFSLREVAPTALSTSGLWLTDSLLAVSKSKTLDKANDLNSGRILLQKGVLVSKCQKCGHVPQYQNQLVNITNAKDRRMIVRPDMLPSFLSFNPVEIERLRNRIFGLYSPPDIWWQNTPTVINAQEGVMEEILTHASIAAMSSLTATDVKPTSSASNLVLSEDEGEEMENRGGKNKKTTADGDNVGATASSSASVANASSQQQSQDQAQPVVYKWSPLDVLCEGCFTVEFQRMSYAWWLEERQTDKVQPHNVTQDCWWGMECTTQRRHDHAIKLNHCCPKTRRR